MHIINEIEKHEDLSKCVDIVKNHKFNIKLDDFEFSTLNYKKQEIFRNDRYQVFLIGWLPGQKSSFHKHPKYGCILRVLKGKLHEDRILIDSTRHSYEFDIGSTSYISDDIGVHMISNTSALPAISLHIYSPSGFYD